MPEITDLPDTDEEFEDETLLERFFALSEMFPEPLCNAVSATTNFGVKSVATAYRFGRSTMWYSSAAFIVLVLPVVFEQERFTLEQQTLARERQMLLGPNAVVSGMGGPPITPGMAPPPPK